MGCKLSISVVHPKDSPKPKKCKSKRDIPNSPIFSNKEVEPPDKEEDDKDEYISVDLDTDRSSPESAPDSEQTDLDIYQYV